MATKLFWCPVVVHSIIVIIIDDDVVVVSAAATLAIVCIHACIAHNSLFFGEFI